MNKGERHQWIQIKMKVDVLFRHLANLGHNFKTMGCPKDCEQWKSMWQNSYAKVHIFDLESNHLIDYLEPDLLF